MTSENILMTQVLECCEELGFSFYVSSQNSLTSHFSGSNGKFQIDIFVNGSGLRVVSHLPVRIPNKNIAAVLIYITKINNILRYSNLDFDLEDREVYFRNSVYMADALLTKNMFKTLLYTLISHTDSVLAGLFQILFGQMTPLEAFQWLLDRQSSEAEAKEDEEEETDTEEDISQLLDEIDNFLEAGDD